MIKWTVYVETPEGPRMVRDQPDINSPQEFLEWIHNVAPRTHPELSGKHVWATPRGD
jgi:hypothetical protein